jgi:CRP-like cAMP-binding protein
MKTLNQSITEHEFFDGMKSDHLAVLTEGAKFAEFKAGDLLFRDGQPASQFFLIESGRVVLEAHEPAGRTRPVQTLGAGEVLGWSWLFSPFVWHLQGRAIEPTIAVVLDGGHLLVVAERNHEFGYELMKRVSQVVIHRLQAARRQLLSAQVEAAVGR